MPLPATVDLGAQLDAMIRDESPVSESAPDTEPTGSPDAHETPEPTETSETPPAAETEEGDDDGAYKTRFEADYQERSKKDIAAVQRKLNPQISAAQREARSAKAEAEEANAYTEFLLGQLREYDPEAADTAEKARKSVQSRDKDRRELSELRSERAESNRNAFYGENFPGIDPNHPLLRSAFERNDRKAEQAALVELLNVQMLKDPEATPSKAKTPARDESGKFVAQNRIDSTRQREQARGKMPIQPGAGTVPTQVPLDKGQRVTMMKDALAKLGVH